jgi:hypothetical protein
MWLSNAPEPSFDWEMHVCCAFSLARAISASEGSSLNVIQEGARIYGDGVKIAARAEGLAEGRPLHFR